ncbi:leucine-rich repeat domain-containing protein [Chaetoceros tenuissimus]|uniref:Leucine-rich repeat domain-containing protein n=1 Tax=Chaetoceros tenuissimus TaxID=426638 RepID=A0AAD3CE06_9STRA|nr:leucine-rich repeat domain-containing protein [Chaetoceros tenuissimus]
MRVQTEEWRRFIPGVRMYKGKKTLFWNGEKLWEGDFHAGRPLIYDHEERGSWEVIIILPGVEVIPTWNFCACMNVERVIMADTVKRIEEKAFMDCTRLVFVKLSTNLEYIGLCAFACCCDLTSIFIPPSCREIVRYAFQMCERLIIFHVPQHTQLGDGMIEETALLEASPFADRGLAYGHEDHPEYSNINNEVKEWLKNINHAEEFALHRAFSSFNPLEEIIYELVKHQGISSMKKPNGIGITPMQYLQENPFAEIEEKKIVNRYVLDMMGEIVV